MASAPAPAPEPLSDADLAAIRTHRRFRELVEQRAAVSLAAYHALPLGERWLTSDLGRTALAGAVLVLNAWGGLTLGGLLAAKPVQNGLASPGRVRAFAAQALAYGLIERAGSDEPAGPLTLTTPLAVSARMRAILAVNLPQVRDPVLALDPATAPAFAAADAPAFQDRLTAWMGAMSQARPDLFEATGRPVHLFQGRDGGSRMLEALILRQPPDRGRLLQTCVLSRSELARAALTSRAHVNGLLADGEAAGWLALDGKYLTCSPALSDDVERYYATTFALTRTGVTSVHAQG